jgi:hypothetical protein
VIANGTGCILGFSAARFLNYIKKWVVVVESSNSKQEETTNTSDNNHTVIT